MLTGRRGRCDEMDISSARSAGPIICPLCDRADTICNTTDERAEEADGVRAAEVV